MSSSFNHRAVQAAVFVLVGSSICGAAAAQSTVVVTGSREPLAPERLAADVVVIDAATIQASTADSLADLLRREAGVQLSRSGGPGQTTGVFIRGASSSQTVLLVDGVRVGSATLGTPSFEGLGLAQIDRIEVLRGPGSSLYGADAIGGVVQVFTKRGQGGNSFAARAAVGGYGGQELSASVQGASSGWDYAASLSREKDDGVSALRAGDQFGNHNPDDDGHTLDSAQAQIGFKPAPGHRIGLGLLRTRLDSQYDASEFLPPNFAQDNTPNFRTRLDTEVGTLDWRGTLATSLIGSAKVSRSVDDVASGGNQIDLFKTTRDEVSAQLAWQTGTLGQLTGALEHSETKSKSTSFLADVSRRNNALVVALDGGAAAWSWQADVRHDDSSDFGSEDTGRLGGSYEFAPGLRVRALAGSTFRAPSFNDLYFPGYGVPTLVAERGRSIEMGLNWKAGASQAAATVYQNKLRDMIGYTADISLCPADPAYGFGCAANINRAKLEGATLSAAHQAGALGLRTQLDWLEARDEATGQRLQRRAAFQGSAGAEWNTGVWNVGGNVLHLGSRPDGGKQLAAETTLDLSAGWKFLPKWSLQAKLLNATDVDTEPARDYQGLGRQAWLALRFEGNL